MNAALVELLSKKFSYISLSWDEKHSALTMKMAIKPVQCYSLAGMSELQSVLSFIDQNPGLVKIFVFGSDVQSVFNFGGDLALFVLLARAKDVRSLKMYGQRCLDLVWWIETAPAKGVYTVVVVQGDALGGGLESVLPFNCVVAEQSAQVGFPEILFNLFPGMGAWNLVSRRASPKIATEMITSGKVYNGAWLKEQGLVDVLAEDTKGWIAAQEHIEAIYPKHRGLTTAFNARNIALPITRQSLDDIVDTWAHSALKLTDRDLRLMERLVRAQLKKVGGAPEGAIEEIKKMELEQALAAKPQ